MPDIRRRLVSLVLLVGVVAVACTDPLAPRDIAGTYTLHTLRGLALPTPLRLNDLEPLLIADTLVLEKDGLGLWIDVYEFEPLFDGSPPDTAKFIMNVYITERNGQLYLGEVFTCTSNCREPREYPISRWNGELVLGDEPRYYTKVRD